MDPEAKREGRLDLAAGRGRSRRRVFWIRAGLAAAALVAVLRSLERMRASHSVLDGAQGQEEATPVPTGDQAGSPAGIVPGFRLARGPLVADCPPCGLGYTGSVARDFLRHYTGIPDLEGGPR